MSARCSICRHPPRDSINVSLLRDGTRSTGSAISGIAALPAPPQAAHVANQCRPSRSGGVANRDSAIPLRSRIEGSIQCCENLFKQAQANNDSPGMMRAMRELRGHLELSCEVEKRGFKGRNSRSDFPVSLQTGIVPTTRDDEVKLRRI